MSDALKLYVKSTKTEDGPFLASCAAEAEALVTAHIGKVATVPEDLKARAILEVGAELFHRRSAVNGIVGLQGVEMTPMRIARDPMKSAYPLLDPFLGPGIG